MIIHIETIEHSVQNYETVGNYWEDENGVLQIRVSEMNNEMYNGMVATHELIEFLLTRHKGVKEEVITKFDLEYEEKRKRGEVEELSEPGFDNNSPYLLEHSFATSVELGMCAMAGISWNDYNKKVESL